MCFYYDVTNEFCASAEVRARKPHGCEDCDRTIQPGERYERTSGKCEGDMFTLKTCLRCKALRVLVHQYELARGCAWDESWPPTGYLADTLRDYRSEDGAWADDDETWVTVWPDAFPEDVAAVEALAAKLRAARPALKWPDLREAGGAG